MAKNVCPSCERPNPLNARFCNACGTVLIVRCAQCGAPNEATRTDCRDCGAKIKASARRPRRPATAASTDGAPAELPARGLTANTRPPAPDGGVAGDAPADLKLVLLDIPDPAPDPRALLARKLELIQSDPDPSVVPAWPKAARDGRAVGSVPRPPDEKTARRAVVRRAVSARAPTMPATPPLPIDVLVLDADDDTRASLCELLEDFGFRAHPARSHAEVTKMLKARPFCAAFVDVLFDGAEHADAAVLCQLVKQSLTPAGRVPALIIVSGVARPAARVRATLAGADEFLTRPVTRGAMAGALEACAVPLPSDPRRT